MRHQRLTGGDELRQHRQHEDDGLGIADVDQKTAEHHGQRLHLLLRALLGVDDRGRLLPLLVGQIEQVGDAEPFDEVEGEGGGGQHGTDTGRNDEDLQGQGNLQPDDIPVAAPKTILQSAGHGGNGTGPRRQADDPAGGEKS